MAVNWKLSASQEVPQNSNHPNPKYNCQQETSHVSGSWTREKLRGKLSCRFSLTLVRESAGTRTGMTARNHSCDSPLIFGNVTSPLLWIWPMLPSSLRPALAHTSPTPRQAHAWNPRPRKLFALLRSGSELESLQSWSCNSVCMRQ